MQRSFWPFLGYVTATVSAVAGAIGGIAGGNYLAAAWAFVALIFINAWYMVFDSFAMYQLLNGEYRRALQRVPDYKFDYNKSPTPAKDATLNPVEVRYTMKDDGKK